MSDLDRLLNTASRDVGDSVTRTARARSSVIIRRARRRIFVTASAGVLAIAVVSAALIAALGSGGQVAPADSDERITGAMILEDGVVTETEYWAGAQAVVACLAADGIEAVIEFDTPNRHASFQTSSTGPQDPDSEPIERCIERLEFGNVSLGWGQTLGQVDLFTLRDERTATVECVEQRTGVDFGEPQHDQFGYPTPEGQQTIHAAVRSEESRPWVSCQNELGFLAEDHAGEQATFDCVEQRTGQDFGDITYDKDGFRTPDGDRASKAAIFFENHEPWDACQEELGFASQTPYGTGDLNP